MLVNKEGLTVAMYYAKNHKAMPIYWMHDINIKSGEGMSIK